MADYVLEVEGERYAADMRSTPRRVQLTAWIAGPDDRAERDPAALTPAEREALNRLIGLLRLAPPHP
jgi:hypothetical protein